VAGILFATAGANLFDSGDSVGTASQAASVASGTTALDPDSVGGRSLALQDAFTQVAENVNPAVVQIRATRRQQNRNPFRGTPFENFFGGPDGERRSQGLGSGAIIRPDGYVVTNNHVVEGADELSVRLFDGSEYDAEIVGTDPPSDLAVLKIDATDLPDLSFGNSDNVKTGQWVLAFGSPLSADLSNTVTAGIVSAVGRLRNAPRSRRMQQQPSSDQQQFTGVQNFIQTDAAINPGNSGGPLVNLQGQMVGINSAIISQTGGYQGIGFSIPVNTVERVTTQLIERGDVRRARLGVSYGPVSPNIIEAEDLPRGAAGIGRVEDGSAADEAGLQAGDIIVAIEGEPLRDYLQLGNVIGSKQPGETISITVNREGERRQFTVELGAWEGEDEPTASAEGGGEDSGGDAPSREDLMDDLGIAYRDLTPDIAEQLGLDSDTGVIITEVDRSREMVRDSGLQPKQIIVRMAGQTVEDGEALRRIYSEIPAGEAFRLVVRTPQGFVTTTALRKPSAE
jgi:serine protease Do